jgi:hypothetical protein
MLCLCLTPGDQTSLILDPLSRVVKSKSECMTLHTSQDGHTTFADLPRHNSRIITRAAAPLPHLLHMRGAMELYLIPPMDISAIWSVQVGPYCHLGVQLHHPATIGS